MTNPTQRALKLTIAYDGARFRGWATQPGERTVQGELEAALEQICGRPVPLTVAGRTDAGVHAWTQVASSPWDGEEVPAHLLPALNATTGPDVAVTKVETVGGPFDARRNAVSRTYCYRVEATAVASPFERGRALHWPYPVDRDVLDACAGAVLGQHDFTAFTPTDTEHVFFDRTILEAEWRQAKALNPPPEPGGEMAAPVIELWATADAWMRNMARILVGTMLETAGGKRTLDDFCTLLDGAPRERAGQTAPPHGLYLAKVSY